MHSIFSLIHAVSKDLFYFRHSECIYLCLIVSQNHIGSFHTEPPPQWRCSTDLYIYLCLKVVVSRRQFVSDVLRRSMCGLFGKYLSYCTSPPFFAFLPRGGGASVRWLALFGEPCELFGCLLVSESCQR